MSNKNIKHQQINSNGVQMSQTNFSISPIPSYQEYSIQSQYCY